MVMKKVGGECRICEYIDIQTDGARSGGGSSGVKAFIKLMIREVSRASFLCN